MHTANSIVLASLLVFVGACAAGSTGSETSEGAGGGGGASAAMEEDVHDASRVINGCTRARATNITGRANVTIHFPSPATSLRYSPACVRVSKGTKITWAGDFSVHPLQAGKVNPNTEAVTVNTNGPIHQTTSGTRATFRFNSAGTFGYFCERHFRLGMKGAVYVD
jgi:plastocyanin